MRHQNAELWNVQEAATTITGAKETLKANQISATNRLTLANAAAATGSSVDEMLATIGYRMRRAAQQPVAPQVEAPLPGFETELEDTGVLA